MHHFPGQRNTFQRQGFRVAYFRSFSHDLRSTERDTTVQACRFSCFFCAAYGLLLTQTLTQCSNSASRAIAMLEKSAKISPNAWAVVSLSNECGHVENSYVFINDTDGRIWGRSCVQLSPNKRQCQQSRTAHLHRLTTFHNQSAISPLPRADLWQIFAGLASIAIALQTLFEHCVRVCL